MTKPKRLTKKQRREREIAALEQRVQDIFTGASGSTEYCGDMVSALGSARFGGFVSALCDAFDIDLTKPYDETSNPHVNALRHWNYDEMETPWMLAEHLHDMGIRA